MWSKIRRWNDHSARDYRPWCNELVTVSRLPDAPGQSHPVIDSILEAHAAALGGHLRIYRHHCLYVYHSVHAMVPDEAARSDHALAVAAAFHDLGLFTEDTIDYLEPSVDLAAAYCEKEGRSDLIGLVTRVIENHHKITPVRRGPDAALIDAFRRADWQFVMMGAYPGALGWRGHRALKRALPTPGFHRFIVGHSARHVRSGKRNPLPILRW